MHREITLKGKIIPYTLRLSKRAKYVNITVYGTGELVVSLPHRLSEKHSTKFLLEKQDWIYKNMQESLGSPQRLLPKHSQKRQLLYKNYARIYINRKLEQVNSIYNFKINRVLVKNQKSQWGSCSSKGNLNFNYKLVFLPQELAEYVIIHELCHIKEFNHSKRFWELVAKSVPNHHDLDKRLHNYHLV